MALPCVLHSRLAYNVCSSDNTLCSGGALVYHSNQEPSYRDAHGAPHRCTARTMWQAVTPDPQDPQRGFFRSTPDCSNSILSSSGGRNFPSFLRKMKKGIHLEPGMWPGSTPERQEQSCVHLEVAVSQFELVLRTPSSAFKMNMLNERWAKIQIFV